MNPTPHPTRELSCSKCGQPDAHAVSGEILCASCCHELGSCGAVREADDPPPTLAPKPTE